MSIQDKTEDPSSKDHKEKNLDDTKNNSTKDDANAAGDKGKEESKDPAYLNQKKRAELAEKERDEAKAKAAELEAALNSKADSKGEVSDADIEKLAEKHDVSPDFVKDLLSTISSKASADADKLVSSKLSEKEKEDQKKSILTAFKNDFDKLEAEWEGATLSESAVRMHYLTQKAKNPDHTVADSIEEIYGSFKSGKATVEDDPRGADQVGESIDFAALSKDPAKLEKVLKDPKARTKYYTWRDKQGL